MALKNLSTETMTLLSTAWTDSKKNRGLLESIPVVHALLPSIDAAHAGVVATRKAIDNTTNETLAALTAKAEATDSRHDKKVRGTYWILSGLAEVAEDAKDTEHLLNLRDRIIPKGLATTTMSYSDEAGNAELVRQHLDAATHAALKKWKTLPGRTLDDEVNAWLEAGHGLGGIEAERARLERQPGNPATDGAGTVKARNHWIKAVNALVSNLDLVAATVDPNVLAAILGPLQEAEARADRRGAAKKPADTTAPASPTPPAVPQTGK